jgi:hypothetical protein
MLEWAPASGQMWGLTFDNYKGPLHFIQPGDTVQLGDDILTILLTPGHSPGSICFYCEAQNFIISGDVLFREGIGRSDLPGGNEAVRMHAKSDDLLPASAVAPSDRQRTFLRYFTGTLIDLVVLGLFDEYSSKVHVFDFTTLVLASILLQFLLKWTIIAEHHVLGYFEGKSGLAWTSLKLFVAWLILFGSKFVILEALSLAFGDLVQFHGVLHGIVWLIIVVVTMIIIEEVVVRFYRRLA